MTTVPNAPNVGRAATRFDTPAADTTSPVATDLQRSHGHRTRLGQLLVALDLLAATLAWTAAVWHVGRPPAAVSLVPHVVVVPVLAVATVLVANARRLYWSRVCTIRTVEVQRMGQVVLIVCGLAAVVGPHVGLRLTPAQLLIGGLTTFGLAITLRGAYQGWLTASRRRGRYRRQVAIVGTNEEADCLLELVSEHPQLGLDVVGFIGSSPPAQPRSARPPHLGPTSRTEELVKASGASGVLIATSAVDTDELNGMARSLLQAGIHVHLSTGLQGFAAHRMRPQLLAHESVLYLEPLQLDTWQLVAKRTLDIVVGTVALVLSLPVLALAALAIKVEDGGPVVFRQTRVGRGGKHFTILKLRTMVVDAEARYDQLAVAGTGRDGPLVKLRRDPRVTTVGRVLRASSIDELPQLVNVLKGSMSLVGPRPNLLVEAEGLDPAFLAHKCQVRPGVTGLWQVEARDDPAYKVYRRLDVFYLENWSISLDLAILLVTIPRVLGRTGRFVAGFQSSRTAQQQPSTVGGPAELLD